MSKDISNGDASENLSIVLPLKKRELGNFITSLLGQQQSINRTQVTCFDIDHEWLINLHEMIDQRICQQANASLVDFIAVIYFDNGLKRIVTTIETFKGYVETKKEETISIMLHWNYLIQFPNKPFPEKQEITFFARAKQQKDKEAAKRTDFFYALASAVTSDVQTSFIGFEISHTERTWGDDLEALISNETEKVVRKESDIRKFIYNCCRFGLAFAVFVACTVYPLYYVTNSSSVTVSALMSEYQTLTLDGAGTSLSVDLLSDKLDLIAQMVSASASKTKGVFSVALTFLAPFLVFLTLKFTRRRQHSFFSLSKADHDRRDFLLRKEKNSLFVMVGAYIFAIAAGIIGNYGYSFLTNMTS